MNPVPLLLGVAVLVVTVGDLIWTTLWVEGGAGPLTTRLTTWTWRAVRAVGARRPRVLTLSGPVVLLFGVVTWIVLLWAGWTLIFAGAENTLVDTRDPGPISWSERVYFVGYSLFTLGNGDFAPRDGVWQILTALTTATGMLFITLIVSYVISVLDAVTQKRAFASDVSGLGRRGEAIVLTAWDGERFRGLALPLHSFTAAVNELTTNHHAYPVLHYFDTDERRYATVPSVIALDEALTLLRFGVSPDARPSDALIKSARASVGNYLDVVTSSFAPTADSAPPTPELDELRAQGVPTVAESEFSRSLADSAARRKKLAGLVVARARDWPTGDTDGSDPPRRDDGP